MSLDGLAAGKSGIGDLTEGFTCIHVRDVYLHRRDGNRFQGIQYGNRSMGVGGGIDDDSINSSVSPLDLVHQVTFMIGLILLDFNVQPGCGFIQKPQQIRKGALSVDTRFPNAEHIDVRAVDDQNLHGVPSRILRIAVIVCESVPLLSMQ